MQIPNFWRNIRPPSSRLKVDAGYSSATMVSTYKSTVTIQKTKNDIILEVVTNVSEEQW
jgi:hypothetical protein